jgi:hypothetical protein
MRRQKYLQRSDKYTCDGTAEVTVEEAGWNLNASHSYNTRKTRYLRHTH